VTAPTDDRLPSLHTQGPVATITLHRPARANRLTPEDLAALMDLLAQVNADPQLRVLRLAATGRHFCAGYDIGQIGGGGEASFEQVAQALEDARPVTLALIQGGVFGGATDLALACDFRLGVPDTEMFMPAARLGLVFYPSGLQRYVSRLGLDTAKRLFLTAERIGAAEMMAIGFLTQLVPADELAAAADRLSETLVGMAPIALLAMKQHLNHIARGTLDTEALQRDMARAAASEDLVEGKAAFAERRAPRFKGR